jgi:hypothetical protein
VGWGGKGRAGGVGLEWGGMGLDRVGWDVIGRHTIGCVV